MKRIYSSILIPLILAPLFIVFNNALTYTETVYSGPDYSVVYVKQGFEASNLTTLSIQVTSDGKPLEFGYTLIGITVGGATEVKRGKGSGRVVVDISSYVGEVERILERSHANPQNSGVGLLTFIVTMTEENGEKYISTDIISIPVIPGKAAGATIEVNTVFKPVHRVKYHVENSTTGSRVEPLTTSPPPRFDEYCTIAGNKEECWYWRFNSIIYASQQPEFIPVLIVKIDPHDDDYVKSIHLLHFASLMNFRIGLGMGILGAASLYALGVGFTTHYSGNDMLIYSYSCVFHNRRTENTSSHCYDEVNNEYMEFQGPYDEALLATGFGGYLWLVKYDEVHEIRDEISHYSEVLDEGYAVFLMPNFKSSNKIEMKYMVDEDPYDDSGLLEAILNYFEESTNIKKSYLGWHGPQQFWTKTLCDIGIYSSAAQNKLFGVPVGAIIKYKLLRETHTEASEELLAMLTALLVPISIDGVISFETTRDVYFNPYYYEVEVYLVESMKGYYTIPVFLMDPHVI